MLKPAKYFLAINDSLTIASDNDKFGVMIDRIHAVSSTNVNVLLIGQLGSGKELVAEAIHSQSKNKGCLLRINCAALPSSLLESELFGYKQGAFTGATHDKKGMFDIAKNGSIFLDELSHMDITLQAKLLRAVEYGEYNPIGSDKTTKSNARIIAAVNQDLGMLVKEGQFREDLYYRLATYIIFIPTLEERKEDIERLINYFFNNICKPSGITEINNECILKMKQYNWPGNVRELKATIQSATINASYRKSSKIELEDLDNFPSQLLSSSSSSIPSLSALSDFVDAIYNRTFTLKQTDKEIRKIVLKEIRDREKGCTKSISKVLSLSEDNVRNIYARANLTIGSFFEKNTKHSNKNDS